MDDFLANPSSMTMLTILCSNAKNKEGEEMLYNLYSLIKQVIREEVREAIKTYNE